MRELKLSGLVIATLALVGVCIEPASGGWRIADYGYFEFRATESRPESIAAGDLTGDGRADVLLVARNYDGGIELVLYTQQPNGALTDPITVRSPFTGPPPIGVALGDLDGDGRLEAVIGGVEVAVFRQFAGSLIPAEHFPAKPVAATGIGIGDLDSDGRNDIVYAGQIGHTPPPEESLMALMNRGDRFETRQLLDGFRAGDIELGDVTGDGRTDVVTHTWDIPATVTLVEQLPGGAYRRRALNVAWAHDVSVGSVAIGDVTGDGLTDIAFSSANRVGVLAQSPRGTYSRARLYPAPNGAGALEAGDINHDGRIDLAGLGSPSWSYFLQMPDGTLAPPEGFDMPYASSDRFSLALVDYTGDGLLDLTAAVWNYGYEDGLVLNPQYGGPRTSDHLPQTWITAWPGYQTAETTATFEFTSSEPDATYLCSLDGRPMRPCTSPLTFELSPGGHQFAVRATDRFRNSDPSPAIWSWQIAGWGLDPPNRVIDGPEVGPGGTASPFEEPGPAPPGPQPPTSPPVQPSPPTGSTTPAPQPVGGGAGPTATAAGASAAEGPRVQAGPKPAGPSAAIAVTARTVWVSRRRVASVPLACRPSAASCRGRLVLFRSNKAIGRSRFDLRSGRRRVVAVRLNGAAYRRLGQRRRLTARAVVTPARGIITTRVVTLRTRPTPAAR